MGDVQLRRWGLAERRGSRMRFVAALKAFRVAGKQPGEGWLFPANTKGCKGLQQSKGGCAALAAFPFLHFVRRRSKLTASPVMSLPSRLSRLLAPFLASLILMPALHAQVVVSEISSVQSDRLL